MANYLPVLLVNTTTATPDDNVLTNIPRGQVDYLSHEWQEEDVWRSWRNMTRQKNEITNGIRLENASWRTWWKQRNKLKTVSPETLNWLKDSDVTWLYGPLHTAVDWAPPPKPKPVPDSVDKANPASTHDRLDLHSGSSISRQPQIPRTKPILKYRSISEMLTSDLPVSPIFSPAESEDESQPSQSLVAAANAHFSRSAASLGKKRPNLTHTKSDTHISRRGSSHPFRKESPPCLEPLDSFVKVTLCQTNSTERATGTVRSSLSQDSTSSASGSGSTERSTKKKHITFNTFVEQCIAIEKPKLSRKWSSKTGTFGFGAFLDRDDGEDDGADEDGEDDSWNDDGDDDDGYEEDREDNFLEEEDPLWLAANGGSRPRRRNLNGSAIHSDSDSDDGGIEIRPSSYRHSSLATANLKKKGQLRSKSASSSSSATTTTTSTSTSSTGTSRQRRKSASAASHIPPQLSHTSATSTYRPRPPHSDSQYRDRVTIAPIAPTLLKTTGAWEEGFGDEGGVSDDGLWEFGASGHGIGGESGGSSSHSKRSRTAVTDRHHDEHSSESTSVELVYVPPFGTIYGYGAGGYWNNGGDEDDCEDGDEEEDEQNFGDHEVGNEEHYTLKEQQLLKKDLKQGSSSPVTIAMPPSGVVPAVIVDGATQTSEGQEEFFDQVQIEQSSPMTASVPVMMHEREIEGARGRSASVSPTGICSSLPRSSTSSSSGGLLSARGRTQSCQDLPSLYNAPFSSTERRGRSSMRATPNSTPVPGTSQSSTRQSSRGHSLSPNTPNSNRTSPMGSLSPDGSDGRFGGIGSAYASGRTGGREREYVGSSSSLNSKASGEDRRGRAQKRIASGSGSCASPISGENERGRSDRRSPMSSTSPQKVISAGEAKELTVQQQQPDDKVIVSISPEMNMNASICSFSSEGSTPTIVPRSPIVEPNTPTMYTSTSSIPRDLDSEKELRFEREAIAEAEGRRQTVPTPSNSPTIVMSAPRLVLEAQAQSSTPSIPSTGSSAQTHSRSQKYSNTASKPKLTPPIVPSPVHIALPSTSPSVATFELGYPVITSDNRSASRSLERTSSGSRERTSPVSTSMHTSSRLREEIIVDMNQERALAEAKRGRAPTVGTTVTDSQQPISPTTGGPGESKETIMNKAVGMVSSAGAYLRLWPHHAGA